VTIGEQAILGQALVAERVAHVLPLFMQKFAGLGSREA